MQIGAIPANASAGSTHCVTVTGVSGVLKVGSRGALKVVSVTQSNVRPSEWVVCFSLSLGAGVLVAEDGPVSRLTTVRGR